MVDGSPEAQTLLTVRSADGTPIACYRSGSGPALLVVHGSTNDHTNWDGIRPELEPFFTVYAMERRGRGESGDSPAYAFEREAEDLAALVQSVDGPVHVMGHSSGAVIALEALHLTSRIASLMLYDPPVISAGVDEIPAGFLDELEGLVASGRRDEALGQFYRTLFGRSAEEIAQLRADPSWKDRLASAHTVARELRVAQEYRYRWTAFQQINQPTLLLIGELSTIRLHASVAALHAALPASQVVTLSGQGHGALRVAPKQVAAEVLAFMQATAPAPDRQGARALV